LISPTSSKASSSAAFDSQPLHGYEGYQSYQQEDQQSLLHYDSQQVFNAEVDAAERSVVMEGIERDVGVVHELFVDLHGLVHSQSHTLDALENTITQTHLKSQLAAEELYKAEEYQRRRRKRLCWLVICAASLILFILFILYLLYKF